ADDVGMDIAFAADRDRVAQIVRHRRDHLADAALGWHSVITAKALGRLDRPGPGPKILGGDIAAADLLQIIVDVAGADRADFIGLVAIFEQMLALQFLAGADDPGDAAIADRQIPLLAAFAAEQEFEFTA